MTTDLCFVRWTMTVTAVTVPRVLSLSHARSLSQLTFLQLLDGNHIHHGLKAVARVK